MRFCSLQKWLFLFCFLCCSGCKNPPTLAIFEGVAMTVPYQILVGKALNSRECEQVHAIIEEVFCEIDRTYNKWNPASELSCINRADADIPIRLSEGLFVFLKRTESFVSLSQGRFDPTIEPLQQLWRAKLEDNTLPTAEEIASVSKAVGWHHICLERRSDGPYLIKTSARTALDLGGIVKGYAVDLLVESMQAAGFSNIFVEWGGEIRTSGYHPEGRPWRAYIAHFEDRRPEEALAVIELENGSIATSGDYLQQWTVAGTHFFHLFDPQALCPYRADHASVASVTVRASDCTTADAIATILLASRSLDEATCRARALQAEGRITRFWIYTPGT